MYYFAVVDETTSIPVVVGAFVTIIGAFLGVAKIMLAQATKDRESDRAERMRLADAIEHMAKNSSKVAEATTKAAKEAKQRNGHLGEQNVQITKLITEQHKDIKKISKKVGNAQVVKEQKVEHQTVRNKN